MVELINKDYADFVNLSTNLVGMDKALNKLSVPLGQLREVLSLRSSLSEGIRAVDERMCKQEDIRKKKHIAHITAMLQQSLGGLLLEGLQTSNVDIIRHCLRTYATIDKTRDAEASVGQVLVKPYMDEVIVEQIVESHPDGLKIMYANKFLEFVPHHCRLLREVTGGAISRKKRLGHRQYRLKDNRLKTEWRTQLSASQGETFEESNPTATLILDFQRPEP
ncbi:conserved oligomeric Golgi complex subunit 2-like isoform X6 [Mustela putorius furo]|uniref:Conserved oligomeric Golgi complex subunit 2 n=1 Tax=Mustela putorius furo TaxID=9669 RepID=A0A8U0UVS8_MUSPF|nr:conserved oligomeric Golgi complex subunit 2-like isoform X6 [Mustela putorius furo]